MKKVKLSIQETLRYQREMEIEVPDNLSIRDLNILLDDVIRNTETISDIPLLIRDEEIKITQMPDMDTNSPWDTEIEIDEIEIIEEE